MKILQVFNSYLQFGGEEACVEEIGGALRRHGGEVKTPERVPYTADLTVLASINAAGGFTPYADQRRVRLLRGTQVTVVDVKKIRANPSLDLPLEPGDKVEVPQSLF
ncbi:MAG TPA: SLBB domain-containing protein [Chthoniobacterales bacterium]|jgi:polysaccharide export outer membrane protein|nr:SLBB domain-containing protein [Chthoniobacterales bacterium]